MKISEIIEKLEKEFEEAGDIDVAAIELPPIDEGEVIDMRYN